MDEKPPSTRLDIGQDTKRLSRSTSTTSIDGSHRRMYFAAVAPPKPPPMTTTRAFDGIVPAQPAREKAPASFRESLRFMGGPGRRVIGSLRQNRSPARC